jgi:cytosine/adenosine deaminase-related metal-dependent hydrolase
MPALNPSDFPTAGYALHVDVALGPDGPIKNAILEVENGLISGLSSADGNRATTARPLKRLPGTAVIPGILDVHHHIIEPFVKALTGGEPAQMWRRIWLPLEAAATEHSVYLGSKWTFLEALRGGITTIIDHGIRTRAIADAIHRAAAESGIRLVSSTGVYDLKNFNTTARTPDLVKNVDEAVKIAERHVVDCRAFARITPSLACGTVQSNSGTMISAMSGFCRDAGILFQVHANEHTLEVHAAIEAYKRRPLEYLFDLGALGRTTLVAHATLVTSDEMAMLKETDTAVAYNPVASMWKGNAVAPALDFMTRGIRVGLGSDATRNDGFRMIDAAEAAQRIFYGMLRDDFSCGAGWRWVHAATQGGADVALLGQQVGSLSPGKKADFLLLDCSGPEVRPRWDFTWELVRYFDRADILAAFVDGEAVMIGGRSTRYDSDKFMAENEALAIASVHEAGIVRLHGTADQGWSQRV